MHLCLNPTAYSLCLACCSVHDLQPGDNSTTTTKSTYAPCCTATTQQQHKHLVQVHRMLLSYGGLVDCSGDTGLNSPAMQMLMEVGKVCWSLVHVRLFSDNSEKPV